MRADVSRRRVLEWHRDKSPVPDAALRDHMLGKMTDIRSFAAQDCDLKTGLGVEMHVQSPERQFVVLMKRIHQPF